ncbi:GGDEF domain-containing protein [Zobellella endophytica]|nr:GGDEF domain-containing protein [Zobellella endophytica]
MTVSARVWQWIVALLLLSVVLLLLALALYRRRFTHYRRRQGWQARRLGLAVSKAGLGLWEWLPATGKLYWSPSLYELYGLEPGTAIDAEQWKACLMPEDREHLDALLRRGMATEVQLELGLPAPLSRRLEVTGTWVYEQRCWRLIGLQQDRTKVHGHLRRMSRQAYQDRLTGLPNRGAMTEQLAAYCRQAQPGALIFLDLDGFKAVNDHFGHDAGDALLLAVAERLSHSLRLCDRVYRLGGDEFVVWLAVDEDPRLAAARVAALIIDRLEEPFGLDGQRCCISTSLGIALYPADAGTPEALLRLADQAMYRAKRAGKGCYMWAGDSNESISAAMSKTSEKTATF